MKVFEFDISEQIVHSFFPKKRVKTKLEIINILMDATRYMLSYPELQIVGSGEKIVLVVDKMSRLFFFKENKYFSIAFPFLVIESDENLKFFHENYFEVDSYLISKIISTINCDSFGSNCSLDFADSIDDFAEGNDEFWPLLKELMLYEDGYIRYDKDSEGYELAKSKGEENRHPLNHYDVYYSNRAAFKLGLSDKIIQQEFFDLLNIKSDCHFVKKLT